MELHTFWDKERKRSYEGHIHIGPTSSTHCSSCDGGAKPLARGIAVHFTDKDGRAIFATGPVCFKKHTNIQNLSSIPTIGFGFSDISTGRKHAAGGTRLSGSFKGAVEGLVAEQQDAYANVLLRARVLPAMGFKVNQQGLEKYLEAAFPYDERNLKEIMRYVEIGISKHRPSLDQLCRAQYVAYQIDALKKKPLWPSERDRVQSFERQLKERFGLTNSQMETLERSAKKHGLHLQETGIRFPENQQRFEQKRDLFNS